jgi:hypothetical protein
VLAFSETRVHPYSYRKTLVEAFRLSPYLLRPALHSLQTGRRIKKDAGGKNYRLPSNITVIRMLCRCGAELVKRLLYGAFFEKRWRISTCALVSEARIPQVFKEIEADRTRWNVRTPPPGYSFLADPFFGSTPDEIFVEALEQKSGKGRIMRLTGCDAEALNSGNGVHLSYPGSFLERGIRYVLPEMAQGGAQAAFTLEGVELRSAGVLEIDGGPLLDPTFLSHLGKVYLFANLKAEGSSILRLWVADSLFARVVEHSASPIRVSARGSRMAGAIGSVGGQCVRFGQDARHSYGDGVLVFAIEELSPETYREALLGGGAFRQVKGPHTIGFRNGVALFDWYQECFSPFAGLRRVMARL